jgi:large subunit ribosomal protein L18|tara:strand:- start:524 stop:874 length:351 start_codon:yes stop_codon:yes gene_type:complete
MSFNKEKRRLKIRKSIRSKLFGTNDKPRISIFKSNKGIYSQIIDDNLGLTLVSCSSNEIGKFGQNNIVNSKEVGVMLAKKATKKGISKVIFDRSGYLYHGKIKSFADGAREGGLIF